MRPSSELEICVVGAGPRGLSVLERLCANEKYQPCGASRVLVHLVDPWGPGAGQVWRADQSAHLLMNTVASQITLYTDASVSIDGPIVPGPSLYEWAATVQDGDFAAQARRLGPDDYPTRGFYGRYLDACFRAVIQDAPAHVEVRVHTSRAVAMADVHGVPGGPQGVRLEDGTRLNGLDAVVLALGHVPVRPTVQQARTASLARIHYLTYVTPSNPADVDLEQIAAGEPVLLRGLGLNFFDYMALLTSGRGGRFVPAGDGNRLEYLPSGREPVIYAFSRRGVPYHARGHNEKGAHGRHEPRLLTAAAMQAARRREERDGLRFGEQIWPLIRREIESIYYEMLLRRSGRPDEAAALTARYLVAAPGTEAQLLEEFGVDPDRRWDWGAVISPLRGRSFSDQAEYRAWLLEHLEKDVQEARQGNLSSPLKAALDALRDLRNEIRLVVDHGGLDGNSHRDDLEGWYTPLNAFLSIGPPAERIEQLMALIRAGVVDLLGAGVQVRIDAHLHQFCASSTSIPGLQVRSRALIEARLHEPDLYRTEDPLLRHLLNTDQCRPYGIRSREGQPYITGGLAVTTRPYHLVDGAGHAHPRRFAYGIPTESVHWATAAGVRPGVNSVTLADSDAIARAVLQLPPVAHVPVEIRPLADGLGHDRPMSAAGTPEPAGVIV
ncbi:FAD/NAD(P)-binding protein [Kineosporia sp. NBRC 101731]|uniref:FAD/NAD(P)-binding protein n=1 Tax=Kineosporia sp. NBRC 101731 TaxID=3032199 RepID=UPI0024A5B501|nr:FAD/NAD(P)-binding protein [Kineosporia sp. NBRC 101731]GLY32326.1 hypothetical protein Kisp02_56910 [Kineosporia sp. NBRC 101731]